jgi:predicted nucleic acid-binding protein
MNQRFADTFYFIALLNPADHHHDAAMRASEALREPLVTTWWVLVEVADALSAPASRRRVAAFLRKIEADPEIVVAARDDDTFARGLDLFERRPDKGWSLTDCISFVVMTDRGLTEALTGDHHFEQAGFLALLRST